jgi:hypothetical protein
VFVDDVDDIDAREQLLDEILRNHGVLIIRPAPKVSPATRGLLG